MFLHGARHGSTSRDMSACTINLHEAAHFGALAADWWDPHGSSAKLHKLNRVRLAYIRDQIDAHWQVDARERYALAGRSALDVGCGAGQIGRASCRERVCKYV